jgi:hypothetical protein
VFTFIASVFLSGNWILIASLMETDKSAVAAWPRRFFLQRHPATLLAFSDLPMVAMENGRWSSHFSQFKKQVIP